MSQIAPPWTSTAIADALRRSEWCNTLSDAQIAGLAPYFTHEPVAHGRYLFNEGQAGSSVGLLLRGLLGVTKRDYYGDEKILNEVAPGDTFGEMSFLDGQPRSASLRAVEESEALVLTRESYERLIAEQPTLAVALLEQMCRSLSSRVRRLTERSVQYLL